MKKALSSALLLLAGLLLSAAACEVVLRLAGFSAPIWYEAHPALGWSLRPAAHGWFTTEGRAYSRINSAGFRDRDHALAKPPHSYRIAVLGDSVPEALQVDMRASFWWLLQDRLRACPALAGRDVEVLNFGVSGYGTAQEALQLERTAIAYRPDLVLLAFAPNDVRNNSRRLEAEKDRPFFVADGTKLKLDDSFARLAAFKHRASAPYKAYRSASDWLRIVQLVQAGRHSLEDWRAGLAHADAGKGMPGLPGIEPGTDVAAFAPPRNAEWAQAWDLTEHLIDRMHAFSASKGARFVVTLLTHSAQIDPDPLVRKHLQDALGVPDLFYIERRLGALGDRQGFPVIALGPEMQREATARKIHFHGFGNYHVGWGHWNEAGHRAAAEIIAPRLCAEASR